MLDQQLLAYQQQLYHSMGIYHQALAAYWADVDTHTGIPRNPGPAAAVRTTGSELAEVLARLRTYLDQLTQTEEVGIELAHVDIYTRALHRELALIK